MKVRTHVALPPRRTASAAVELAVVLPLLLLIVFGCVDFGRSLFVAIALENAVGSGSDYAASHRFTDYTEESWKSRIRQRVTEEMQNVPNYSAEKLNVTIETVRIENKGVRVTVTAIFDFTPAVDWPGFPASVPLRHRLCAWQYR